MDDIEARYPQVVARRMISGRRQTLMGQGGQALYGKEDSRYLTSIVRELDRLLFSDAKTILGKPDQAMSARIREDNPMRGGIDLNSTHLSLRIKRDDRGVPLPWPKQDLAQLSDIQGLEPVILSITPAVQTPVFAELIEH